MKKKDIKYVKKNYNRGKKYARSMLKVSRELACEYLDEYLFEMERYITPLAMSRTLSKEQSRKSLIDASMNLQVDIKSVLNRLQDENLEKDEDFLPIFMNSLMWLYGKFEKVTNRFDIPSIDAEKNPILKEVGEIVLGGQQLVCEMLLNFFNISIFSYTRVSKNEINEKYQNFFKMPNITADDEIETKTIHCGFIDNDEKRILQKEMVAVYRKPPIEKEK